MNSLELILLTFFNPSDMLLIVKRQREKRHVLILLFTLLLFIAVRIINIYAVHFPLAGVLPQNANFLVELGIMLVPILTWTVSIYAITTILSGEMKFLELMTANMYCLYPYIVMTLPIALFSNILSTYEAGLYRFLNTAVVIWILILLFYTILSLNNTSFFQTVGLCVLGLVGMLLIWCVILLLAFLTVQFICFIQSLMLEIRLSLIS